MGDRGQMGSGGDNPGVGSLGWFRVVVPTTCWATLIITRIIPSRTAVLMAYKAAVFAHVVSSLDQEQCEAIHIHSIGVVVMTTSSIGWLRSSPE